MDDAPDPKPKLTKKGLLPRKTGRPPGSRNQKQWKLRADLGEIARCHTDIAIQAAVDICLNPKIAPHTRLVAAWGLLDRGWGKPRETVHVNVNATADFSKLTDARLISIIEGESSEGIPTPEAGSSELN